MQSWPGPHIPRLPHSAEGPREIRVTDSAQHQLVQPLEPGAPATMYVCGITPYDATHLGHAATYLTFDLLNRAWRDAGHEVTYTQNVTDVDDPLLERATETGVDWTELAADEIDLFREDMAALRILPPSAYVGAVESIDLVVKLVERLRGTGAVYEVDDDLYFAVHDDPAFGHVSGLDREQMLALFAERGGDPDWPGKRDPLDCLLWQAARPGEPAWDSPLGRGRPGWHIECAAIALDNLGSPITVQGGGTDLIFPHHEMSASEAQLATGDSPFAHAYVHQAMVGLDGEKMSKSKGNLVKVSVLRADGADPMAIRLALLDHDHTQEWSWTDDQLPAAEQRLARWRAAADADAGELVERVRDALADGLDSPRALREVDAWLQTPAASERGDVTPTLADVVDALLGVELTPAAR